MNYSSSTQSPSALKWVDHKRWSDNWECIREISEGGQGIAMQACRKSDKQEGFLKVVRDPKNSERRKRFFREASAYDTMDSPGIPRLIESNAYRHDDSEVVPYIVTEFIDGPTLHHWRQAQSRVQLETSIKTTRELLQILTACHNSDLVHRDVKPDNVVLARNDPGRPVLLDFGLNFQKAANHDLVTEQGQELGNRFLRLPELSADSPRKQDPRSDITFAAGILYYLLTGKYPRNLQDEEGRLPHQRDQAITTLKWVAGSSIYRLLGLFDRAFAPRIADRFTNTHDMLTELERITEPHTGVYLTDKWQDIIDALDTESARRQAATEARLNGALNQLQRVHKKVRTDLKSNGVSLNWSQSNWTILDGLGRNTLAFVKPGSSDRILSVLCEAQEIGDEIVIRLSGEPVYRTSVEHPNYGDQFDVAIQGWLIDQLQKAIKMT